jgi:hypothetical protein
MKGELIKTQMVYDPEQKKAHIDNIYAVYDNNKVIEKNNHYDVNVDNKEFGNNDLEELLNMPSSKTPLHMRLLRDFPVNNNPFSQSQSQSQSQTKKLKRNFKTKRNKNEKKKSRKPPTKRR